MSSSGSILRSMLVAAVIRGATKARMRIFGHILNPTIQRSPHKVLHEKLIGEKLLSGSLMRSRRKTPF